MKKPEFEPQNLARSCHEALILAALASGPRHGYQLALEIEESSQGYFRFNHGTLYPILHKLEGEGLIQGAWQDPGSKRKRRQYSLTDDGSQRLDRLRKAWHEFSSKLLKVIEGGEA